MKTPSSSNSVKNTKNKPSTTEPSSTPFINSKQQKTNSKGYIPTNGEPNVDGIIPTDVNINLEMSATNNPIETDNTTNNTTQETNDSTTTEIKDSFEKPLLTYPFIKESDDSIEIFIYNTDAGKEGDLIHFYDNSYWELVGLHPELEVSNERIAGANSGNDRIFLNDITTNLQKGGDNENASKDESVGPYQYFQRFLSSIFKSKEDTTNNESIFSINKMKKSPEKTAEVMTGMGDKTSPTNKDDGLLYIHPTVPDMNVSLTKQLKEEGANLQKSVFNTTATPVINTTENTNPANTINNENNTIVTDNNDNTISSLFEKSERNESVVNISNIIVLTFFPNQGIKPYKEVIEKRNQDIDIDITQSRYKFKEIEKLKMIKDTKKLAEDVSIEEVFYINGKIVVLKGMLNMTTNSEELKQNDLIDVDVEILAFPHTRGYTHE